MSGRGRRTCSCGVKPACTHTRAHLDARTCRSTFRSSWQSSTRIAASTIFKNPTRPTLVACLCVGGCGLRRGRGRWRRRRRWEGVEGVRSYACTFLHSYPPAPLCTDLFLYTTHTRTHTHVHACTHTHTHVHACMHACIHIFNTYTHREDEQCGGRG